MGWMGPLAGPWSPTIERNGDRALLLRRQVTGCEAESGSDRLAVTLHHHCRPVAPGLPHSCNVHGKEETKASRERFPRLEANQISGQIARPPR